MLQDFDRVIMRINCRRQRFPPCFRRAHELSPGGVVRNGTVKLSYLKPQQCEVSKKQNDNSDVSATYPDKPFLPLYLPRQLNAAAAPAFRQKIQFNRRG